MQRMEKVLISILEQTYVCSAVEFLIGEKY